MSDELILVTVVVAVAFAMAAVTAACKVNRETRQYRFDAVKATIDNHRLAAKMERMLGSDVEAMHHERLAADLEARLAADRGKR
jgi:hypothetical protein